ncbi:protein FAM171A1 [Synchiropus splendidus]|uniref:protein FAM171A1 n=1 Tax=Synchiropus splendidus TaxID=270530 RepID=UPI00237D7B62|nr:protein FAM171A1 [Synchiropus splendidus]
MMRAVDRVPSTAFLLFVGYLVSKAASKTLSGDKDAEEVTLKVHLSDANTQQPLGRADVQLFTNHSLLTTGTSLADGDTYLRFLYRPGTPLIVTATKQGYVPNSVPWTPSRLPVFSSISLNLLPERAATLMVYEDVVEILSDFQGFRAQPVVHFQRRALNLPSNSSYANLSALLTVTSSPSLIQSFPHLQILSSNTTGTEKFFELTPVAAISVHLLASDGAELQVNEPITVAVPLPSDSILKENDHIPAWRYEPRFGAWIKSSLGYVRKEANQLTLTYIAPKLGYWVAAMSPLQSDPIVAKDISTYHTMFLLAILGGMALILLCLLCVLLYFCRRRCLKPRGSHCKLTVSSGLDSSRRDQATSMSHINLISNELELVSVATEPDMTTPMLKSCSFERQDNPPQPSLLRQSKHSCSSTCNQGSSLGNLTARSRDHRQSAETFQLKAALSCGADCGYRQSFTSICSSSNPISDRLSPVNHGKMSSIGMVNCISPSSPPHTPSRGDGIECRAPDYLLSRSVDHLERPNPPSLVRPGQLLCCGSVDLLSGGEGYPRVRPTLVIPAHYMRLPGEHPLSGQALLLQTDQQSDLETIQAELNAAQPQNSVGKALKDSSPGPTKHGDGENLGLSESLSIPAALGEAALVEINSEDTLLAEKTLMELRGGKPLPHPRAWFVSLDGRSNAHIRHSYIDLQRAGYQGNTPAAGGQESHTKGRRPGNSNDASLDSGVDLNEPKASRSGKEGERSKRDVEDRLKVTKTSVAQLVFVDDMDVAQGEMSKCSTQENKLSPGPSDRQILSPPVDLVAVDVEDNQTPQVSPSPSSSPASPHSPAETEPYRTDRDVVSISPDEAPQEDMDDEKKSPWQRREERPLLAFNLK